jgi:hypothetical protein
MFGFALGVYLVYGPMRISPSNSGFTLTVAGRLLSRELIH